MYYYYEKLIIVFLKYDYKSIIQLYDYWKYELIILKYGLFVIIEINNYYKYDFILKVLKYDYEILILLLKDYKKY